MPSLHTNLIKATAVLCLVSAGLMSCAQQASVLADHSKDYASLSGKLAKDMTEKAVSDAVGATPDKADIITCTDHAGKQWQCRTWVFASKPKESLRVVFYQADDASWRVAAWDTF
jgi:hypothetical protein